MREEKNINFHFYSGHIIAKQVVHKTWRLRHNFAIIISRLPILFKWTLGFTEQFSNSLFPVLVYTPEKGNAATWRIEKDRNLMGDLLSCEYLRRWWISRGFVVSENRVKIGKSENQKIDDVIRKSENR